MADVSAAYQRILDRMKDRMKDESRQWVRDTADLIQTEIETVWPSPGSAHPYATGESLGGWTAEMIDETSARVYNTVEHSNLTNEGYTRSGKGTASTFGGESYTSIAMASAKPKYQQSLNEMIKKVVKP
jgi:hypothetical protein